MPSISSCPECHRDLTLPDLVDGKQSLRCPLCDARFPAERVMADSVSFPPAAIVVSTSDDVPPPAVERPAESEPWSTATSHDTGIDEDAGRSSQKESGFHGSDVNEPDLDESELDESSVATADEDDSSAEDSGVADSEVSPDYASFGRQAAAMRTAPRTRREASAFSLFGQFVGIAVGGVLGLALGYWILLWILGAQADFLHLRGKLPRWLLPARRHNEAGKNLPMASRQGDRIGQPGRSLGDVLRDPPDKVIPDASSTAEPSAEDTTTPSGEPSAATDVRPVRPRDVAPIERGPPPTLPGGHLGPRAFRPRTVSELTSTLERADRALRCPHCQAPTAVKLAAFTAPATDTQPATDSPFNALRCDYCRGKPLANLTVAAFDRLCDLAEIVTFVQFDQDDPHRDECRRAAEAIAMAVGSQRDRVEIAGRLAGARLDESQRQSNGIVLAGTVQRAESEGDLFVIQIMLFGSGKPVTVISRQPPEPLVQRRDRLVVLGSIVDSPRDNLAGYAGNLSQVVWGGLPLKLASAAR